MMWCATEPIECPCGKCKCDESKKKKQKRSDGKSPKWLPLDESERSLLPYAS